MVKTLLVLTLLLSSSLGSNLSCVSVPICTCNPTGLISTLSFTVAYFPPSVAAPEFMPLWVGIMTSTQLIANIRVEYMSLTSPEWLVCDGTWNPATYYLGQSVQFAPWIPLSPFQPGYFTANFILLDSNDNPLDCYPYQFQF